MNKEKMNYSLLALCFMLNLDDHQTEFVMDYFQELLDGVLSNV